MSAAIAIHAKSPNPVLRQLGEIGLAHVVQEGGNLLRLRALPDVADHSLGRFADGNEESLTSPGYNTGVRTVGIRALGYTVYSSTSYVGATSPIGIM